MQSREKKKIIDNKNKNNNKPVALIVGAGAGIGGAVAKRFAIGGNYHVCLCRRSNGEALEEFVQNIRKAGGSATGYLMDVTKADAIENLVEEIETTIGPIKVAIYNLGAQFGFRPLTKTTYKQFELGWKMGTFGLFRLAKCLLPRMADGGGDGGTLIVTSSTASVRGDAGQHAHTAAMGGRRMLCQSLNAEYSNKGTGIHVVHVVVDGPVDSPDTLGKLLGPQKFALIKSNQNRQIISPKAVAETYWHLAHQPPSTRTFELDLRSQFDIPWWNSSSSSSSSSSLSLSKL